MLPLLSSTNSKPLKNSSPNNPDARIDLIFTRDEVLRKEASYHNKEVNDIGYQIFHLGDSYWPVLIDHERIMKHLERLPIDENRKIGYLSSLHGALRNYALSLIDPQSPNEYDVLPGSILQNTLDYIRQLDPTNPVNHIFIQDINEKFQNHAPNKKS